jgi:GNAT superfamily N-acetyltransferase
MNNITFRRAKLTDVQALYALSVEFERYNQENSTRPHEHFFGDWEKYFVEEIEESIKRKNSYVYLALVDAKPQGYIFARLCKGCYAFIVEELFVRPEFSKLGIGSKLLDFAVRQGKKLGHDIKVEVFDWNQSAKDYYLKKGFFVESLVLKHTL